MHSPIEWLLAIVFVLPVTLALLFGLCRLALFPFWLYKHRGDSREPTWKREARKEPESSEVPVGLDEPTESSTVALPPERPVEPLESSRRVDTPKRTTDA